MGRPWTVFSMVLGAHNGDTEYGASKGRVWARTRCEMTLRGQPRVICFSQTGPIPKGSMTFKAPQTRMFKAQVWGIHIQGFALFTGPPQVRDHNTNFISSHLRSAHNFKSLNGVQKTEPPDSSQILSLHETATMSPPKTIPLSNTHWHKTNTPP